MSKYSRFLRNTSKIQNVEDVPTCIPGGPIPQNMARALMPRQPQSEAVLSTGGRLHPSLLRREGLVRMWSPPWLRRDGVGRKAPSLAKEGWGGSKKHLFGKEVPFASEARKGGVSGRIENLPRNNTFVFRQKNKSEASFTRNLA